MPNEKPKVAIPEVVGDSSFQHENGNATDHELIEKGNPGKR